MDKLTPCPFILTLLWFCHIPDILYQVLHFFVELGNRYRTEPETEVSVPSGEKVFTCFLLLEPRIHSQVPTLCRNSGWIFCLPIVMCIWYNIHILKRSPLFPKSTFLYMEKCSEILLEMFR